MGAISPLLRLILIFECAHIMHGFPAFDETQSKIHSHVHQHLGQHSSSDALHVFSSASRTGDGTDVTFSSTPIAETDNEAPPAPPAAASQRSERRFRRPKQPSLVGAFFSPVTQRANALAATIDEPTLPLSRRIIRFLKLKEPLARLLFAFGVSSDIHFLRAVCGFIAFIFWISLITTVLGTYGVNIQPFVATLGLSGFLIGFAMKELATNLLSGILLVVQRPIRVGWLVNVAGHTGTVTGIDSRYVILQDEDGKYILIPSYMVYSNTVIVLRMVHHKKRIGKVPFQVIEAEPQSLPAPPKD